MVQSTPIKIGTGKNFPQRVYIQCKNGNVWFLDCASPKAAESLVARHKQNPSPIPLKKWRKAPANIRPLTEKA